MKKTLALLSILGFVAIGMQTSAEAFCWSNLNPAYWGHCPKCQKVKSDCGCKKKTDPCDNLTGGAAPTKKNCNPCNTQPKVQPCPCEKKIPCEPCDKLQNMTK